MLSRFNRVRLFAILWIVALQAPLSMGFSRQEYWSGLPFPSPGDLPNPGTEPASLVSPALQADSLPLSDWGMNVYFLRGKKKKITKGIFFNSLMMFKVHIV